MSVPEVERLGERPLEELVQNASQQAVAVAREQIDVARRELSARARQAGPGVAMVGGGVLLGALASGTGTAALILLGARRARASAAALGVTGAYAGAGTVLVREGLVRLREVASAAPQTPVPDEPAENAEGPRPAKRRSQSAAKSSRRVKSAAASSLETTGRPKREPKASSSRRRASGAHAGRTRRRAS
jgi:hypothetical protein